MGFDNVGVCVHKRFGHIAWIACTGCRGCTLSSTHPHPPPYTARFEGIDVDAVTPSYGSHIVVGELSTTTVNVGNLNLSYVELSKVGQLNTDYPAIYIKYLKATNPINRIEGCSFTDSFNAGIEAVNVKSLVLRDNVFFRTYRSPVFLDAACPSAVFVNNAAIVVLRGKDESLTWVRPFAGFFLNSVPALFQDNLVGGSQDTGVVIKPESCTAAAPIASGTEVHAALVGVFVLSVSTNCAAVTGIKAWKCAHIGILTVDQVCACGVFFCMRDVCGFLFVRVGLWGCGCGCVCASPPEGNGAFLCCFALCTWPCHHLSHILRLLPPVLYVAHVRNRVCAYAYALHVHVRSWPIWKCGSPSCRTATRASPSTLFVPRTARLSSPAPWSWAPLLCLQTALNQPRAVQWRWVKPLGSRVRLVVARCTTLAAG